MAALQRLAGTALVVSLALATVGCTADEQGSDGQRAPNGAPAAAPDDGSTDRTDRTDRTDESRGNETVTRDDPRSTFAIDIDTASYGYASRVIGEGRRPARDDVRPEEFVNSFDQDYPEPRGDGFAISVDGARLPSGHRTEGDVRLLRVGLRTRGENLETRPTAALTFVVDVSGSMADPGRLDLVRDALHTLVDQLRPTDAVAVVAFNERPRVMREMTHVSDADALHRAIDDLEAGGSTNLEGGLITGYETARSGFRPGSANRVIIASDGLANVGSTQADPILRRVSDEAGKQISLLGVGVGSQYGDALMERLADRGDGFVVYASERSQARKLFVERLPAALTIRAMDAKVQVSFDERTVRSYRLIGYDNRALSDADFRDDRVDGGEVGPGHSVTALYEVRLAEETARSARVADVQVRWLDPVGREPVEASRPVTMGDLERPFDGARPRLWVCYAAAYLAEALRGSRYGNQVRLEDLVGVARDAYDRTGDRDVQNLADLIDRARKLI